MIATKGQLVRLTDARRLSLPLYAFLGESSHEGVAKVLSLVYLNQPEGQRGVQLDRNLGSSPWWLESDLESVE